MARKGKGVVNREGSTKSVVTSGNSNKEKVSGKLHEFFEPYMEEGEEYPDFDFIFVLLLRVLVDKKNKMVKAYNAHMLENKEDRAARIGRNEDIDVLYSDLTGFREVMSAMFKDSAGKLLRFEGKTPRDASNLNRFTEEVIIALKTTVLPEPKVMGASFDVTPWIERLETQKEKLNKSVELVGMELRETEQTMITKNQEIEEYDEAFSRVANAMVGLFRLAGENELAARVKPSVQKPGRTLQIANSEDEETDKP